MKRISIAILGAFATAVALPAAAQSALSSVYVGGDLGQSKYKDACNGLTGCDNTDTQWGLFAGYQFNRNFAAELGYHDLGSVSTSLGDIKGKSWEITGVGSVPITEQFSAYGKLGGYHGTYKGTGLDNKNNDLTFGFGVQYDLNRNVGLRGEWQRYDNFGSSGGPNVDVLRVAALWRFQ